MWVKACVLWTWRAELENVSIALYHCALWEHFCVSNDDADKKVVDNCYVVQALEFGD